MRPVSCDLRLEIHGKADADHGQRENGIVQRDGRRGEEAEQGGQGSHPHHHARLVRDRLDRRPVDGFPAQQQIGRVHQGEYAGIDGDGQGRQL